MRNKTFPEFIAIAIYRDEVSLARLALSCGNYDVCFSHLERAHIVSQGMTGRHIHTHWSMFVAGLCRADYREVLGQIPRMLAALFFSKLWVPSGNSGRARVSAFQEMPVPEDLRHLFFVWPAMSSKSSPKRPLHLRTRSFTMTRAIAHCFMFVFAAALSACSSTPPALDLSLMQSSLDKKFVVELQPPSPTPAINQMHSWRVRLSSPSGHPVTHAHIEVDGGMPQHGHGLPTHPQVTREVAAGVYLLEGMKFSMSGWWEIRLTIQTSEGTDKVTFNTVVDNAVAAK